MGIDEDPNRNAEQFPIPETLATKPVEALALGSLKICDLMGWVAPKDPLWANCEAAFRKASQGERLGDEEYRLVATVNGLTRAYTRYYLYGTRTKYDIEPTGDNEADVVKGLSDEEVELIHQSGGDRRSAFIVHLNDNLRLNMTIIREIQERSLEEHSDPTIANEYFKNLFLAEDGFLTGIVETISERHEELERLFPESNQAEVRKFAELYALLATRVVIPPDEHRMWRDVRRILNGGLALKGLYGRSPRETIKLVPASQKRTLDELDPQDRALVRYLLEMNKFQSEETFPPRIAEHLYDLYDDSTIEPRLIPLPRGEGQRSRYEEKLRLDAAIRRSMNEGPNPRHSSHIFGDGKESVDDGVGHLPGDSDDFEDPYNGDMHRTSPFVETGAIQTMDPGELPPKGGEEDDDNPFKKFINDLPTDKE